MFNLNEKYFPISERCGRNHQNKFLFTSPKETFSPWELNSCLRPLEIMKFRLPFTFIDDCSFDSKLRADEAQWSWFQKNVSFKNQTGYFERQSKNSSWSCHRFVTSTQCTKLDSKWDESVKRIGRLSGWSLPDSSRNRIQWRTPPKGWNWIFRNA